MGEQLRSAVDLLIDGFPCRDVSSANRKGRLGLKGDKSGLFDRIVEVLEQLKALHSEMHFVLECTDFEQKFPAQFQEV